MTRDSGAEVGRVIFWFPLEFSFSCALDIIINQSPSHRRVRSTGHLRVRVRFEVARDSHRLGSLTFRASRALSPIRVPRDRDGRAPRGGSRPVRDRWTDRRRDARGGRVPLRPAVVFGDPAEPGARALEGTGRTRRARAQGDRAEAVRRLRGRLRVLRRRAPRGGGRRARPRGDARLAPGAARGVPGVRGPRGADQQGQGGASADARQPERLAGSARGAQPAGHVRPARQLRRGAGDSILRGQGVAKARRQKDRRHRADRGGLETSLRRDARAVAG